MHVEVSVALNFVISYLYNKLPRRRVDMFGEEMERGLKRKFEGHWYDDKPFKGSAYRCIRVSAERVEPVIEFAASLSRLDLEEICDYLPRDLTIWIDPGEVSYRIGEKGVVKVVYSSRQTNDSIHNMVDREIAAASKGFNPDAQCFKPIDSLSSSLSNLSVSPGTTSPTMTTATIANGCSTGNLVSGATSPWATGSVSPIGGSYNGSTSPSSAGSGSAGSSVQNGPGPAPPPITSFLNRNHISTMTTAMFAQTKFGSTKLKTQAKRPSRLSPTELGAYFKQRSSPQVLVSPSGAASGGLIGGPFVGNVGRPHPVSPRGNSSGSRGPGAMLPPYGMDAVQGHGGLPPFYLLPQHAPPQATSGSQLHHHQQPPPMSELYGPMISGPFGPPPPAPTSVYNNNNNPTLNMPRFHDVFTATSSANSSSSGTAGINVATPSPDSSLSHKTFLEGLNYNNLSSYQTLQHLLVAN